MKTRFRINSLSFKNKIVKHHATQLNGMRGRATEENDFGYFLRNCVPTSNKKLSRSRMNVLQIKTSNIMP